MLPFGQWPSALKQKLAVTAVDSRPILGGVGGLRNEVADPGRNPRPDPLNSMPPLLRILRFKANLAVLRNEPGDLKPM
jgi:hypothetical protein